MRTAKLIRRLRALSEATGGDAYLKVFADGRFVVAAADPVREEGGSCRTTPLSHRQIWNDKYGLHDKAYEAANPWAHADSLDDIVFGAEYAVERIQAETATKAVGDVLFPPAPPVPVVWANLAQTHLQADEAFPGHPVDLCHPECSPSYEAPKPKKKGKGKK